MPYNPPKTKQKYETILRVKRHTGSDTYIIEAACPEDIALALELIQRKREATFLVGQKTKGRVIYRKKPPLTPSPPEEAARGDG